MFVKSIKFRETVELFWIMVCKVCHLIKCEYQTKGGHCSSFHYHFHLRNESNCVSLFAVIQRRVDISFEMGECHCQKDNSADFLLCLHWIHNAECYGFVLWGYSFCSSFWMHPVQSWIVWNNPIAHIFGLFSLLSQILVSFLLSFVRDGITLSVVKSQTQSRTKPS